MRIFFIVQTHRDLLQIKRLVRTVKDSSPKAVILLCHNPESFDLDGDVLGDLPDVHVRYAQNTARGDDSLLREYLASIRWAIDQELDVDWVVNLTGQCYPARPLSELEDLLASGGYDGYMQWFDAFSPEPDNPWGPRTTTHRYGYRYRRLTAGDLRPWLRIALSVPRRAIQTVQPFVRIETGFGLALGIRARRLPYGLDLPLYGGSYFKALTLAAATYLVEYGERCPEVLAHFRTTLLPEESYPQTVLLASGMRFCRRSLHYVNWEGTRLGRPADLTVKDLPPIVDDGYFFARKVSPDVDSQILDLLDERVRAGA